MKKLIFLGDSREQLRSFPETARKNAGESLKLAQEGLQPRDWKSLVQIGKGIRKSGRGIQLAHTASYMLHASRKLFMFCMRFKRRRNKPRNGIWIG